MAIKIFEQQARALGRLFNIASNFTDPHAYFVGGGVVEAAPEFRSWYVRNVQEATQLREEQRHTAQFAIVPDLDMAGARGSAIAALSALATKP
jgi:predicted NBD/HSP70 family sugar kinase